jgi:ABC-type molybdenum transport system ATPase subunit/photorepair protein PhrA
MIEIKNALVTKGGNKLFENFSWKINDVDHWVITGPNGVARLLCSN